MLVRVDFNVPLDAWRERRRRHPHPRDAADAARAARARSAPGPGLAPRPAQGPRAGVLAARRSPSASASCSETPVKMAPAVVGDEVTRAGRRRSSPARSCCSRTSATSRARPRTIPSSRSCAGRAAPTSMSTTRSAPRTARTPRPSGVAELLDERAAGLLLEREVKHPARADRGRRRGRWSRSSAAPRSATRSR